MKRMLSITLLFILAEHAEAAFPFSVDGSALYVSSITENVGIGTTSPGQTLQVQGVLLASATGGGYYQSQDSASGGHKMTFGEGALNQGDGKFAWYDNTSGATRMVIDGSGNVGVGTNSPGTALEIGGSGVLTLGNATSSTGNGGMVYDRTNNNLLIGDGTNTQKIGMGAWQSWTPTWGGFSSPPSCITNGCRYAQIGKVVTVTVLTVSGGTSNSTSLTISIPVAAKALAIAGFGQAKDNTAFPQDPCDCQTAAGSTTLTCYKNAAGDPWTANNSKDCSGTFVYEAN